MVLDWAGAATELLLAPLDALPGWLELVVIAFLTAVIALLAVKYTTNQPKLERARDLMTSTIYEMRLFMDSPRRVLSAQRRLLWYSVLYTGRTLPALVVMAVPLSILYLHLELRFGYEPAPARSLIEVELSESARASDLQLELQTGTVLGPVVDPDSNVAWFRIDRPDRADTTFTIALNGARATKVLSADPKSHRISSERLAGWSSVFATGYEPSLPSDLPFLRIAVDHERNDRDVFGMPWWSTWMIASIAFAFLLRKPLGVTI